MIEKATINGREAVVAYYDDAGPVTDLSQPHFVTVLFDDGEMIILHSDGDPPPVAEEMADEPAADDSEHQHHPEAWDKHRGRFAPRQIKIAGHPLSTWARMIANQDAQRILAALQTGVSAGDSNTDIAHRVIGSAGVRGVNGATEVTRQHILRLGKGFLQKRKTRMGGAASDGRPGIAETTNET